MLNYCDIMNIAFKGCDLMKKKNGFLFTLFCIILIILTTLLIFNLFRIYNKTQNINLLSEYIIKDNEITNKNGLNKENS